MLPSAMAFSRIFRFAAPAFPISPHCARGIFQFETHEYIGGFSLLSELCARAGAEQTTDAASTHSPANTLDIFMFIFSLSLIQPGFIPCYPGRRQCTPNCLVWRIRSSDEECASADPAPSGCAQAVP